MEMRKFKDLLFWEYSAIMLFIPETIVTEAVMKPTKIVWT